MNTQTSLPHNQPNPEGQRNLNPQSLNKENLHLRRTWKRRQPKNATPSKTRSNPASPVLMRDSAKKNEKEERWGDEEEEWGRDEEEEARRWCRRLFFVESNQAGSEPRERKRISTGPQGGLILAPSTASPSAPPVSPKNRLISPEVFCLQ